MDATMLTVLCGAIAAMWAKFHGELQDCKKDRTALSERADQLHTKISIISESVGELRGRIATIEKS
jgi:predicted  nucleic acid-binding Zn-ribbon protein